MILLTSTTHPGLFTMYDVWQFLLAICAAIITISGAIGAIVKWVNKAKEPNSQLSAKVEAHDNRLDEHDREIHKIYEKMNTVNQTVEDVEQGNRVTQRALLAIIDHLLTGNNVANLKEVKDELQQFLINK